MSDLIVFICVFALTFIATGLYRRAVLSSIPSLIRFREDLEPVANGAGGVLWDVSVLSCLYVYLYKNAPLLPLLLLGTNTILFVMIGWIDDMKSLKPWPKLLTQLGAGILGVSLYSFSYPDLFSPLTFILAIILLVWIVNSINFIDILDGLAASVTILMLVPFVFFFKMTSLPFYFLSLLWILSLLSFLLRNLHSPQIYLGDTGAHLLGALLFSLSLEALRISPYPKSLKGLFVVYAFLLFDFLFVCIKRAAKGKSIMAKSGDHLALVLLRKMDSQKKVVVLMVLGQFLATLAALVLMSK